MEKKHPLQLLAAKQRASAVKPGLFHETAFRYHGETLLIWDLRTFMKNPKWRDDAVRKSRRYVETQLYRRGYPDKRTRKQFEMDVVHNESRQKKFHRVMEHLYQQSLK